MTPSSKRTLSSILSLLLLAGLFLGACSSGGGDGGTVSTPPASTPPSGSTPPPPPPVAQLIQQGYLKASNTEANDEFGYLVAISGDTVVVGAPQESSNATGVNGDQANNSAQNSGAVYVFTRTGGVWTQQAYLKASNAGAGDQFGVAVALSGDTLAVGALGEAGGSTGINHSDNNNAPGSGAAYVFTRTGGVWTQQAYVKASNASGQFGTSVALAGDTLAVGAPFEDSNATGVDGDQNNNNATSSGAVYVFTRTAGIWSQQAYVKASNTGAGDRFGGNVDLNGDTLAVGARFEASAASGVGADQTDNSAPNAGAVYVFTRTAGVWTQQAYLKSSHAEANQNFSGSIALGEDVLAVGARLEDSDATGINGNQVSHNAPDSGAVYVFERIGGVWDQKDYLKASNTDAGDEFGVAVALSGRTLAAAAWFEASNATGVNGDQADNSAPKSGAVYVFDPL